DRATRSCPRAVREPDRMATIIASGHERNERVALTFQCGDPGGAGACPTWGIQTSGRRPFMTRVLIVSSPARHRDDTPGPMRRKRSPGADRCPEPTVSTRTLATPRGPCVVTFWDVLGSHVRSASTIAPLAAHCFGHEQRHDLPKRHSGQWHRARREVCCVVDEVLL